MKLPSKWKICLYLAALFFAGTVTGAFVTFKMVHRMMMSLPEQVSRRWCAELESKLKLTPAQTDEVRRTINDGLAECGTLMSAQISTAFSNINTRIASKLQPEQQAGFEAIVKQQQEFMRKRFGDKTNSPAKGP